MEATESVTESRCLDRVLAPALFPTSRTRAIRLHRIVRPAFPEVRLFARPICGEQLHTTTVSYMTHLRRRRQLRNAYSSSRGKSFLLPIPPLQLAVCFRVHMYLDCSLVSGEFACTSSASSSQGDCRRSRYLGSQLTQPVDRQALEP